MLTGATIAGFGVGHRKKGPIDDCTWEHANDCGAAPEARRGTKKAANMRVVCIISCVMPGMMKR